MCGIVGYFRRSFDHPLQINLRRMDDLIHHRGPDEDGYYTDERVGLAMRRLSIIDLSTGQQPMHNETNTVHVVYNGEIYNFHDLRQRLLAEGHVFTTQCDTEVLVHGYETWGEALPTYLRGMFAFALWDSQRQRLMLVRDHFGIKPLYYTVMGDTLLFASEMKALLAQPGLSREIDRVALDQYMTIQYVPEPRTIYQSIKALPAGHLMFSDEDELLDIRRYWTFTPMQQPYSSKAEAIEAIQTAFADSVKSMLVSDVPLGAFLSGGIDSASVVAMMTRCGDGSPVRTFSIGFGERERRWDELDAARSIAQFFKTEHHEFRVEPDVVQLVPQMVKAFDQPFANPTAILLYILSEQTRQHVTVALAGTGGDEMFGGYVRYKGMIRHEQYAHLPQILRKAAAQAASTYIHDTSDGRLRAQRVRRFLESGALPFDEAYLRIVTLLDDQRRQTLYSPALFEAVCEESWDFIRAPLRTENARLEQLMVAELQSYLPFNQLAYGDRMSMAQSLEVRVPLVDQELVKVAGNIPLRWKIPNGVTKGLFREAMAPFLPPEILQTPKLGFNLPIPLWFQNELRGWIADILSEKRVAQRGYFQPSAVTAIVQAHNEGKRDHSLLIWALVVLEIWHQMAVDA